MSKHENTGGSFWSQLGAQAKKAWAGGIAGAVVAIGTISVSGFFADGKVDVEKVGAAAGTVVTGFVVGFLGVFFAPKNHPNPTTEELQPAFTPVSSNDILREQ